MEENKTERKHDINEIAKACTAGPEDTAEFKKLKTLDDAIKDLMECSTFYEDIKDKTVSSVEVSKNPFGSVKLEIIFKNDEICKKERGFLGDSEVEELLKMLKEAREETHPAKA